MTRKQLVDFMYRVQDETNALYSPDNGVDNLLGIVTGTDANEEMEFQLDERRHGLLHEHLADLTEALKLSQSLALSIIEILEAK